MIESIQFYEGRLHLVIAGTRVGGTGERYRGIELDFGEGGAVSELHRGELMDFLYAVDAERAYEIRDLIFELLGAQARVCRIDLNRRDRSGESLEGSAAPNVDIEFASCAVKSTSGEKDIPF